MQDMMQIVHLAAESATCTTPKLVLFESGHALQVGNQQQLLAEQLQTLRDQGSQLQQQQQQKIEVLTQGLAVAQQQQQQTEQQLQQLQQDADVVWNYALTLNEILCKC